ncbi:MAG: D-alanyl-D-alanine carboxypeptidase [Lachnospiraceae bacterium]|nr:D-alanyl-D-alanine carboxypeptidase [Lachnospiraceae bacterium]
MKIKKYLCILLGAVLLGSNILPVSAEEYEIRAPHMYAHSYAVMDANTGEILFGENVDKQIYPASTAKLMSAIVALESGTPLDTMFETEGRIVNNTTPGTYNLGLNGGESYSLASLLNMSLIASAADATDTMAVAIYESREGFAEKMMEKVTELGLKNTSFDNPVGSDIGGGFYETYSTAREMCEITRYAMTLPAIRNIVRKTSYTITGHGNVSGRTISNTNKFYSIYPYNRSTYTIIGSKTGQTTAAGNVFIATAIDDEGHELICAYFGKDTKEETFRWIDNLLTYAFKNYNEGKLTLSKGAYNARYLGSGLSIIRSMDADIFKQQADETIDLETLITEKQAVQMLRASLEQEVSRTQIHSYFEDITGTDQTCSKAFFASALNSVLPGLDDVEIVDYYLEQLPDEVTLQEAGQVLTAGIQNFDLYEMTLPSIEMREWSMENPVPFMSTPKLPTGFLERMTN